MKAAEEKKRLFTSLIEFPVKLATELILIKELLEFKLDVSIELVFTEVSAKAKPAKRIINIKNKFIRLINDKFGLCLLNFDVFEESILTKSSFKIRKLTFYSKKKL
mgnify:CR=1 FL=1